MNPLICTLRVTATGPNGARVSVRRQQFTVGAPIDFDLSSPRIAAIEYALGAVGAEILNGLQAFAWRRRIPLDQVEALENPLTYLEVVGEQGRPRISRIHVKVYVASSAHEDTVRRLWKDTLVRLPLVCTLDSAVRLETKLVITT